MFKLIPNPTFWAKVEVAVPGIEVPAIFEVEFKHLPREAIKTFFAGIAGKQDAEALGELVSNWRGIDAEYSKDNLAALLNNYPAAAEGFFAAFRRELLEARRKN